MTLDDDKDKTAEREMLQQRVSKDCVAKVLFQGKVTQGAVEKLVAYLNLLKDTLPAGD